MCIHWNGNEGADAQSEVGGKMGEMGTCHPLPVGHCQNSEFIPMRYKAMRGGLWPRSVLT